MADNCLLAILPIEIISKILESLDPKTLGQLKVVCRAWRNVIDHPYFVLRMHLPFSTKFHPFLLGIAEIKLGTRYFQEAVRTKPFSTCNGLLLYSQESAGFECSFHVTNLVTRENIRLPSISCNFYSIKMCQLLFDADVGSWGAYKVLLIYRWRDEATQTMICTLDAEPSWRNIFNPHEYWEYSLWNGIFPEQLESLCVNRAVHRVHDSGLQTEERRVQFLAAFDIKEEKFRDPIELPSECFRATESAGPRLTKAWNMLQTTELEGRVCLLHFRYPGKTLDVWLLEDYAQRKWMKRQSVELPSVGCCSPINVFAKVDDESVLLVTNEHRPGGRRQIIYSYNPEKNTTKKEIERGVDRSFWGGVFTKTLVRITQAHDTKLDQEDDDTFQLQSLQTLRLFRAEWDAYTHSVEGICPLSLSPMDKRCVK